MTMIEVKTADLIGTALDYAVAVATGYYMQENLRHLGPVTHNTRDPEAWRPSENWAHGGPLVERHLNGLSVTSDGWGASAVHHGKQASAFAFADKPLVAACRAIVHAKLGDTVQVPKELMP